MWQFREFSKGEIIRDSHEEEFFTMQTGLGAVVRESIQNSLDAANQRESKVTVRFVYGRAPREAGKLFTGLKEHITASGIKAVQLGETGFEFLGIEDFNTAGLSGTTSYRECVSKEEGNFCNFWWFDGSTRKGIMNGGRWGLGKYSFFVFSKMKLFYGISVGDDGAGPVMMGRALLKRHKIGDIQYAPDGVLSNEDFNPITDSEEIQRMNTYFRLERGNRRGFSLIIPYPEIDNTNRVYLDILLHTLNNYLYSIAQGKLTVQIEDVINRPGQILTVNDETVTQIIKNNNGDNGELANMERLYKFYRQAMKKEPDFFLQNSADGIPDVNEDSFAGHLEEMRSKFSSSGDTLIKIRIPFTVTMKDPCSRRETFIDITVTQNPAFRKEPVHCLRNGIKVVNGIKNFNISQGLMLFSAEDSAASEFLGDAENPSHTEWSKGTERMRSGKYNNFQKLLKSLIDLPKKIMNILTSPVERKDFDVLADIFYIRDEKTDRIPRGKHPSPLPLIPKSKPRIVVSNSGGGFRVSLTERGVSSLPLLLNIRTAYDTSEGNPFKKYSKFDYNIGSGDVKVDSIKDGEIIEADLNRIRAMATGKNFELSASGFDPRRDLIIDARSTEEEKQ